MPWKCGVPRSSHSDKDGLGTTKLDLAEIDNTVPPDTEGAAGVCPGVPWMRSALGKVGQYLFDLFESTLKILGLSGDLILI